MNEAPIKSLAESYRDHLLNDVVPFWERHSPDREYGGYFTFLDRAGGRYGDDKPIWLQAREAWLFATLYKTVDRRSEWLDLARLGCDFLERPAFDSKGKMYFCVSRDGRPLRMRRYVFSEVFGILAFAALGEATGEEKAKQRAIETYHKFLTYMRTPGLIEPKVDSRTRPMKSLSPVMCLLSVAETMRVIDSSGPHEQTIDDCIGEILGDFVKSDRGIVLETVTPEGGTVEGPEGRVMNPGHAIECAWFILETARRRGDDALARRALPIIDYALDLGWDETHGGLLYFVDVEGKPPTQLEHDMKLWWPHNEALIATIMAFAASGEQKYFNWFQRVHDWSFEHFADAEYGEWFGYLHRDGTVSSSMKGGMWKGAFHVPRCLLHCWKTLASLDPSQSGERRG